MTKLVEYIKIALMNIRSNKGRSFLTMLGIIIGISSVILIVSAGNGIKSGISGQLDELVGGYVYIYVDSQGENGDIIRFTDSDLDMIIEKVDHIKGATDMWMFGTASAQSGKGTFTAAPTFGNESMQFYNTTQMLRGRYFTKNECLSGSKVCVITEKSAKKLFGSSNVLGMEVSMNLYGITQDYTIIGIRKDSDSAVKGMVFNSAEVELEIPLTVLENVYGYYTEKFTSFYVFCDSSEYVQSVSKQVINLLEAKYNVRGRDYIQVQDMASQVDMISDVLNYVTIFVMLVAAIALIVGRRHRRYEYYAGVRYRTYQRNWYSQSPRRKNRLYFISISNGSCDYNADRRLCRNYPRCARRKRCMQHCRRNGNGQHSGSDRPAGRACRNRLFVPNRNIFRHLSCKKSSEA